MNQIRSILHGSLIVSDLNKALNFYCNILGLALDTGRPDMDYDGAWLWVGEQQIHLLVVPNPDPVDGRPEHGGRDRHIAMAVADLEPLQSQLENHGVAYNLSKSGRRAMFCRDPDGNGLEFVEIV